MRALIATFAVIAGMSFAAFAETPERQHELMEACSIVSQQRNTVTDGLALTEARRRLAQERVEQWEAYFKAYTGSTLTSEAKPEGPAK